MTIAAIIAAVVVIAGIAVRRTLAQDDDYRDVIDRYSSREDRRMPDTNMPRPLHDPLPIRSARLGLPLERRELPRGDGADREGPLAEQGEREAALGVCGGLERPRILSRGAIASQRAERDAIVAADAECACAYRAAETLAILLDRHAGDAGSDPDALASVTDRINDMVAEVRTLLGEPAAPAWRNGECVALVRNPRR